MPQVSGREVQVAGLGLVAGPSATRSPGHARQNATPTAGPGWPAPAARVQFSLRVCRQLLHTPSHTGKLPTS